MRAPGAHMDILGPLYVLKKNQDFYLTKKNSKYFNFCQNHIRLKFRLLSWFLPVSSGTKLSFSGQKTVIHLSTSIIYFLVKGSIGVTPINLLNGQPWTSCWTFSVDQGDGRSGQSTWQIGGPTGREAGSGFFEFGTSDSEAQNNQLWT